MEKIPLQIKRSRELLIDSSKDVLYNNTLLQYTVQENPMQASADLQPPTPAHFFWNAWKPTYKNSQL